MLTKLTGYISRLLVFEMQRTVLRALRLRYCCASWQCKIGDALACSLSLLIMRALLGSRKQEEDAEAVEPGTPVGGGGGGSVVRHRCARNCRAQ